MNPTTSTYRVVRLEASTIRRIKAVEIVPGGDTVTLKGPNAQGKSSILDAIFWALTGKSSLPDRPIREGQSRAESVVDMGDFVVSLKISSSSGAKLTIKSKDGLDVRSPQTLLDSYCNEILLDPVKFLRLGETPEGRRRQAEILRKLVGLDFTKIEAQKSEAYVRRTAINRELDHARSRLAGYPDNPNAPEKEVPVRELMDKLSAIERRVREKLAQLDEKETALLNRLKIEIDGRAGKAQALSENQRRAAEVSQQIETLKAH